MLGQTLRITMTFDFENEFFFLHFSYKEKYLLTLCKGEKEYKSKI